AFRVRRNPVRRGAVHLPVLTDMESPLSRPGRGEKKPANPHTRSSPMKAVCWEGKGKVHVGTVPDPKILNPRDAAIRLTSPAICGSDPPLYDGYIPAMQPGDILGHEFMGEVVEVGPEVRRVKKGDRVVVPFCISCGQCFYCKKSLTSLCDNTNPGAGKLELMYGYAGGGLYGYSHLYGGYAGGQAQFPRVAHADANAL